MTVPTWTSHGSSESQFPHLLITLHSTHLIKLQALSGKMILLPSSTGINAVSESTLKMDALLGEVFLFFFFFLKLSISLCS